MKISHQILIIIFLGLALFLVRDELKPLYDKAYKYIAPSVKSISDSITKESITMGLDKISNSFKAINTPGALRATPVQGGVVANSNNVKLSNKEVISWTNKNRADNGNLKALKENSKLNISAKIKLDDMFRQQYFEHVSPNGKGVADLAKESSYKYIVIGENLALGNFKDAQALLDAWMASPGHRANILNNKYTEIGVAVGHGMFNGQDTWLAVQHFGLPRSACPTIDEVLHGVISLNQKEVQTMGIDLNARHKRIESGVVYEGKTTNEQITEYNTLVEKYNKLILELKQKISDYNSGVQAFNSCLSTSTQTESNH